MSGKTHIVDFEQAKSASEKVRPSVASARRQSSSKKQRSASGSRSGYASRTSRETRRGAVPSTRGPRDVRATATPSRRTKMTVSEPDTSSRGARSSTSTVSAARPSVKRQQESSRRTPVKASRTASQERQNARRKRKADKAFDKNVATHEAPSSEGAPRPAVYKGKMGTNQKRASRMHDTSEASATTAVSGKVGAIATWVTSSRRRAMVSAIVACAVLACAFIYPAAQQYYVSLRNQAQLEAEYEMLAQHKIAMQNQVDTLSTPEGIEAVARQEYGWVKEGENAVIVTGLSTEAQPEVVSSVSAGSVPAPETWYSGMLDVLFAYGG